MQVHKVQDTATKRGKLLTEDFLYLIRKVPTLEASICPYLASAAWLVKNTILDVFAAKYLILTVLNVVEVVTNYFNRQA